MHKTSLGDMEILSNHCMVRSFPVPKAGQMKFAPIIHSSISNHCVGIQVSDTPNYALFFRAGNNITGSSNRSGGWRVSLI